VPTITTKRVVALEERLDKLAGDLGEILEVLRRGKLIDEGLLGLYRAATAAKPSPRPIKSQVAGDDA
jgi:hypothetical protein